MESAPTGLIDITILSVGVGAFDDPNIVGDDVLGVPFIKISLSFARTTAGRPYRFGGGFDVVIVGTGVLDGPKGRFLNRPYGFDCFPKINVCRGGYYPPAF